MRIKKFTFNLTVNRGGKLAKSILYKPLKTVNFTDLIYAPSNSTKKPYCRNGKISKEILEQLINQGKKKKEISDELQINRSTILKYLKKFGLYKQIRPLNTPEITIKKEVLQSLFDKGMSISEIARELSLSFGKVRYFIGKYKIGIEGREEFKILKNYFSAKTQKGKDEAFVLVDNYLKKIAKEVAKLNKSCSYEDRLQDARLIFFELSSQSNPKGSVPYHEIFNKIRKIMYNQEPKIKTVGLEILEKTPKALSVSDSRVAMFEDFDYEQKLWNYFHNNLRQRDAIILEKYMRDNKSIEEIANAFGIGTIRTRQIICEAFPRLKSRFLRILPQYLNLN